MGKTTLILKFGGASVSEPDGFSRAAEIVLRRKGDFDRILVVVSAMGNMTDELHELAFQVNPKPPKRELDMLVSVGERVSISLLAMALAARNCPAFSFTGSQSGIITSNDHTQADIVAVRPTRLEPHLNRGEVVIIAGYQGVSEGKEITTLGRGGSDLTAVALGVAMKAEQVEFYKDVDGVYDADPHQSPSARHLSQLSYQEALSIVNRADHPVLYPRAVALAQRHHLPLYITSFAQQGRGTWIETHPSDRLVPK